VVALDAQAVRASVELVARAGPADMARPTPCEDWTLHGLISHMAAQHYGFAAAAAGDGDPARWRPRRLGADPVAAYRAAAQAVLAAFAADGVLDREFPLPEIAPAPFPARQAISFHLVDYVVHSWDVAAALGLGVELGAGLLQAALRVARAVPQGEARLAPGAAFAPPVAGPDGSPLDQVVAILGRAPGWRRPGLQGAPARAAGGRHAVQRLLARVDDPLHLAPEGRVGHDRAVDRRAQPEAPAAAQQDPDGVHAPALVAGHADVPDVGPRRAPGAEQAARPDAVRAQLGVGPRVRRPRPGCGTVLPWRPLSWRTCAGRGTCWTASTRGRWTSRRWRAPR
jgi:uncharacterized protein (TIGR03086 family)